MSFVIPVAQDKSHAKEATALQGLDRFEVGWSLARLPPFLVFCTSCPGRRFSSSCRLAYGFTPRGRCCYQPLHRRFGVTRKPTGALRSWLSVLPGIRHQDELHPGRGPFQSIQSKSSSYRPVTRPAGASHGVRPLFDGLRSGEVSPYRFGDPSTPFYAALRYSYPRTRRAICIVRLAVLELTLSYRVCQTRPPSTHR
jgi:hypothetical protein